MDLPSKVMYDSFKEEIWKELGPLDPDWFDTLTAQTSSYEGSVSDQDDLCANQEGNFKTPFNKTAADSQLFSTPKVFRRVAVVSPESENEQSTTAEPEKETLLREATQSPYFMQISKEGMTYGGVQHHSQDSLDLLHTPQQSPNSHAKHISESLGAQILPDMSWTSSLNTPPPIQSTLILTKPDESPCPLSVSADKNVFFVRKLFPSLSNASRVEVVLPKNNDAPTIHQGVGSPVAGQNPESLDSPQSSLNHADCVRRQKTDATEDGEIRSTVASVLDGAEDVLSIFFTNRSSALRKVKTDRIKRKQIIPIKDQSCSSKDSSTTNNTAHQEPGTLPSPPPVNTGDIGITQWSPLSLSAIPTSTVDTSYHGNCSAAQAVKNSLTEQLQNDFDYGQGVRPVMTPTHSGFTKKKRKFVYNVETSKQQVKGEDAHKMDSSSGILDSCDTFHMNGQDLNVNHLEKTSAEAESCSILENELKQHRGLTEEHLPSAQAKVLDLDMSQLSRDFAQDFSQMPDPDKVAKDTLQNDFSPSACLSAMKRARQANLQNDHAVSSRSISTTNQNNLISESTISDSGFQSAVADLTHVTASLHVLPSSEFDCGSQQRPGFKSEIDRTSSLTSTNSENGKAHLDDILQEVQYDVKLPSVIKDNQTLSPGRECDLYKESTSTELPSRAKASVYNNNIPSKGQGDCRLPEKTSETPSSVHASGFKTASNRGIHISAANLERAKRLFEETEGEKAFTAQPGISSHGTKIELCMSHGSVKLKSQPLSASDKIVENSCQLTASQKADVTELCTLLEEAESQFEFTQFKTAQPKHHCQDNPTSSQTVDNELDPDLAGIDFDDSFISDPEKHLPGAVMNDEITAVSGLKTDIETSNISESSGLSMWSKMKAEHSSTEEVSSSSKDIFDGSRDIMSAQTKNLNRTGHIQSKSLENKSSMVLGVGFKTAKGNVLSVSKKCLSKARALFADLGEDHLTSAKSPDKQNSESDAKTPHTCAEDNHTGNFLHHKEDTRKLICSDNRDEDATKSFNDCKRDATDCQIGFLMASGKRISISANAMQEAGALFKDCDPMGNDTVLSVRHKKSVDALSGIVNHKQNPLKSENVEGMKLNLSEGPVSKFDIVNARPAMHHADSHGNPCLTTKPFSSLSPTTSRNICTTAIKDLAISGGADAVMKADFLMKDIHTPEATNKQLKQKGNGFRTGHLKNSGFQTASGKGVTISSAALKKSKFLLSEFNEVENEICVKPTTSKIPAPGLPQRNHGFLAASDKPVFSCEASQKGKALFSDSSCSADVAAVSHTRNSDRKKDNVENKAKIYCGFSPAQGAKVLVSQKCLLKTKNLSKEFRGGSISAKPMQEEDSFFNDSDVMDVNDDMSIKQVTSIAPVSGSDKKYLSKYQDPVVTSISEAHGHIEPKSVNLGQIVNSENIRQSKDVEILNGTPKNRVDSSRAASLMAKTSRLCVMSKNAGSSSINDFGNCGGFSTASGKKVSVSEEAINKAKSLLNENAEFKETNQQLKQKVDALTPQNGGFQTASGKGVTISSAALKKSKFLLSDFNEVENEICVKPATSKIPAPGLPPRNRGFLAASDKPAFSCEASQKGKALFSDSSFSAEVAAVSHTRNSDRKKDNVENKEKIYCGFSPAQGAKVLVSKKCLLKTKNLSKEFHGGSISAKPMQEEDSFFNDSDVMDVNDDMSMSINDFSNCGGFSTASGEKVSVSEEAINKAKSLLNENATFEETNQQLKQKLDALTPQNGGFQTASGKGFIISSAALKKAKTLFSECEGGEDKMDVKETKFKMPVPGPSHRSHGFLAASGRPVAFSSDALQKAEALFSDISSSVEIETGLHTVDSEHKNVRNKLESKHGCFTCVEKPLVTAKDPLKDFADGKCRDSNSCSKSPHDIPKSGVKRTSNFTAARNKDITIKESDPQVVKYFSSLQVTDFEKEAKCTEREIIPLVASRLHDSPGEEMSSALDSKINPRSNSEGSVVNRTEESSFLCLQSLNLSGCTETQQRFLAQEALDCTKALLEDENDQRLLMASEGMSLHDNPTSRDGPTEEQKGTRKRLVEDPDMGSQPPLKRRLLEEFDRTVDGLRGSTLHPEKSSPNGVMKDRRVFKYSVSLHPNITGPQRSGKNSLGATLHKTTPTHHSTPGDSRAAHSKVPTFVPPFLKGAKTENHKNTVLKDNTKTPVFVPPFKKQRTIVKETSCKPQEEEDKRHHLFNQNIFTPPSKKTQSTTDGTGNKSKENSQVATNDTANNNLIHQNLPVGCGSEGSAAEESPVMNTLSRGQGMFQHHPNIELAQDMQDMRIRKKKRQTIRPLPGSLFLAKTSGVSRIPLKSAVNGKPPARCTPKQLYSQGVHQHVCDITSATAESFRFSLQQFFKPEAFIDSGGVQLADGGWLIPANNGTAGKEEFYRALCDTPGVDPKLISEEWVYNHYRWIVWKQASMEKSFPEMMGSLCLNPEQVLLQLKYRYDVEVDHSRRPALRKIMERDDTAAKTLVLCVCGVLSWGQSPKKHSFSCIKNPSSDAKVESTSAVIWLTDGWYAIKAQLDEPLTAMLHKGRVAVGGKLIIHGAQLVGSQDACSPLEAPESLMLKICANSSRPTRWDCKMGFHRDPRPFLLPVSSLYGNGGSVGCVDIIILRSYPVQWMERKSDGGVVFRSVRAEEKEARQHNSHKQRAMEILFAKIQAECEKEEEGNDKPHRRTRGIIRQDIASLHDGEELHEAVGDDPAYLEAHLSEQQLESLRNYSRSLMEKKQAELQDRYRRALESAEDDKGSCPKRDVTPVWRLGVADSMGQPGIVYQLSVWRPPSDLQSLLKEGRRYKVYNLTTSDVKKHGGSSTVQLTGTKRTQFQELQASQEWLSTRFQPRVSTHFIDLQSSEFQPLCGEIDLTGYVISIIDEQGFSPAFYLADGELNFVKVRCFTSLAQSGLDNVVKPRVLLAISNLQLRGQSIAPTPVVYAGDLTVFSSNPKEVHLQESLGQLRSLFQGQEDFFGTAEARLSHLIKSDGLSAISSPAMQTQNAASTRNRKQDTKSSVISHQSVRSLGSFTPVSRNPPASNCSTEKSSLKMRRALDYLSHIPSPPPLPLLSSVASPCVNKTFIPPRRSGTPSTFKTVQTPVHKPVSPPMDDEWANDEELAMIDTQALIM